MIRPVEMLDELSIRYRKFREQVTATLRRLRPRSTIAELRPFGLE